MLTCHHVSHKKEKQSSEEKSSRAHRQRSEAAQKSGEGMEDEGLRSPSALGLSKPIGDGPSVELRAPTTDASR
jgi:hypothetical protein